MLELLRGPASALLMVDFGRERGFSPAQLLAGSGLSLTRLADPNFELSCTQELRLINNLLNLSGHPQGWAIKWAPAITSRPTGCSVMA